MVIFIFVPRQSGWFWHCVLNLYNIITHIQTLTSIFGTHRDLSPSVNAVSMCGTFKVPFKHLSTMSPQQYFKVQQPYVLENGFFHSYLCKHLKNQLIVSGRTSTILIRNYEWPLRCSHWPSHPTTLWLHHDLHSHNVLSFTMRSLLHNYIRRAFYFLNGSYSIFHIRI